MTQEQYRHEHDEETPCYVISVAARLVGMHAQSLRHYERIGLIVPRRSNGRQRLYSQADVNRLRQVQRLVNELGVNLAGAEAIIRLNDHIKAQEREIEALKAEIQEHRDRQLPAVRESAM